ncbi:short-chain dehydrogenase [candidate division KSB1 bacterium]|nr:MAG: short-chain dehydrogenase [candidate division KSB1 bacterium]
MMLRNSKVMVLGGWGLVGMAVCRRILSRGPAKLILHSLRQAEAEEACRTIAAEFPSVTVVPAWGDIFVRDEFKDTPRRDIMKDRAKRWNFVEDVFEKLSPERLSNFFLYKLITEHKPDVMVDCVNAATGFAYQDIYSAYYDIKSVMEIEGQGVPENDPFFDKVERFCGTVYVPQLIRHIQVLLEASAQAQVHTYVKVGTTGTGGMGFNIPYTHSEAKPSAQLLAKSSMAGAHSMLLFLMGRTPGCPYVKEIKPAAAIAWKKIAYGEVLRGGKPIPLFDCAPEAAEPLGGTFARIKDETGEPLGENLKSVFIDTGENGIFSADEFYTISAAEQMEFVTPEEISQAVLWEIEGGNSGMDIVGALDSVVMGPTYRAGILRGAALNEMRRLEREHGIASVAFEMLGPPSLSKLLYEAYLLKRAYPDPALIGSEKPTDISAKVWNILKQDRLLRATIVSIGVPILLPDGKNVLRGPEVKIPAYTGSNELKVTKESVDEWAEKGWLDLRPSNMECWQKRIAEFFQAATGDAVADTSSAFPWERRMLGEDDEFFAGRIVTHLFIEEEKGRRIKS